MLGHFSLYVITAEIPFEDGSVRTEEDDVGNTVYSVKSSGYTLGIDDLVPGDTKLFGGLFGILGLIPDSDAENIEIWSGVFLVNVLDVRKLRLARTAPGSPKVDQDVLTLTDIV